MTSDRLDIHNSDVPVVCRSCEARHRGVCGALSPEQLVQLSRHTRRRTFDETTEVFSTDERAVTYANILRGVVKLEKLMADGRRQIVGLKFAPDFLGRLFRDQSDCASVATTGTEICSFPKLLLERIIEEVPAMRERLHNQALNELDEAREWMLALGRKTASEKVAAFLYFIACHMNPEDNAAKVPEDEVTFDLNLTRAEIADFLGLTIETVSRQFTNLRKARLIEIHHRTHIVVPSIKALREAGGS